MNFSSTAGGSTWDTPLTAGQIYSIDSITLTKANSNTTFTELWVGVYSGFTGGNALSGYLGSSDASVAWGSLTTDQTATWSFSGIEFEAQSTSTPLYFVFQTSAGEQSALIPSGTLGENTIAIRRSGTESGDLFTNLGAAIIHGNGTQGLLGSSPTPRSPTMRLEVSEVTAAIPEPSGTAALGFIGLLGLMCRRRS